MLYGVFIECLLVIVIVKEGELYVFECDIFWWLND